MAKHSVNTKFIVAPPTAVYVAGNSMGLKFKKIIFNLMIDNGLRFQMFIALTYYVVALQFAFWEMHVTQVM